MRESVTAILVFGEEVFSIKRQNYLSAFPGYTAFPGGKVDQADRQCGDDLLGPPFDQHPSVLIAALIREVLEEIGVDLRALRECIQSVHYLGLAVTPEFNPYRFRNHYYRIVLKWIPELKLDSGESEFGRWISPLKLLQEFERGDILAVPPTIKLLRILGDNILTTEEHDLNQAYDPDKECPMIEVLWGVKQFLPLSHTFPPANRTNCFLIGDQGAPQILIDPSPKDEEEMQKLLAALASYEIDKIFLTHHHPDHHQFAPEIAKNFHIPIGMGRDTHLRICEKWGNNYFDWIEIQLHQEGDVLTSSLGQEVVVFEVPGHDEGQLAPALKGGQWMIVGDLIQSVGTVVIGHPEGDMKKYFQSLERVIALNPRVIFPSHGIALGGTDKIAQTLKHRKMRESQIVALLGKGVDDEKLIEILYQGLDDHLKKYAQKTIEAHLKKIRSEQ